MYSARLVLSAEIKSGGAPIIIFTQSKARPTVGILVNEILPSDVPIGFVGEENIGMMRCAIMVFI